MESPAAGKLGYDPEYFEVVIKPLLAQGIVRETYTNALDLRNFIDPYLGETFNLEPYPPSVKETKFEVKRTDGATVVLTRFATAEHTAPLKQGEPRRPAVLGIHGGGMVCGSVELYAPKLARGVATSGVQCFAIDYRLAPEHPAPTAVEDSYAALEWIMAHADELDLDSKRVVIQGDSAGGGIAAGLALMARDRGLNPPIAKQILIYPMLDDRTLYPENWPVHPLLTWRASDNLVGWSSYVGAEKQGKADADVSIYAAPGRAKNLEGLPPAYIDTGNLDLFAAEDAAYAARLMDAGVEVEFHLYPGMPHGFDNRGDTAIRRGATANRLRALQSV